MMQTIHPETWKQDLPAFQEKTAAFYAGELDKAAYKGFSGYYGSYAQKGGSANMLRLRMPAGRVTAEKLAAVPRQVGRPGCGDCHYRRRRGLSPECHVLPPLRGGEGGIF